MYREEETTGGGHLPSFDFLIQRFGGKSVSTGILNRVRIYCVRFKDSFPEKNLFFLFKLFLFQKWGTGREVKTSRP